MRNRYGRALYGLAAVITATTTLGLSAAGGASASTHASMKPDTTPACAQFCSPPLFNAEFGPQYYVNNEGALTKVGNKLNLVFANNNNPGQDFTVDYFAPVSYLYNLGFIGPAIMARYSFYWAFEVMWTPYGVQTNLCPGLARNAFQGEAVSLVPCGDFPRTLWIVYKSCGCSHTGNALVSASTLNPSVPYLLTAGGSPFGDENPFSPLRVYLQTSVTGVINPAQLWCTAYYYGDSAKTDAVKPDATDVTRSGRDNGNGGSNGGSGGSNGGNGGSNGGNGGSNGGNGGSNGGNGGDGGSNGGYSGGGSPNNSCFPWSETLGYSGDHVK
jgi:uncharacterized membrane protein YgcG